MEHRIMLITSQEQLMAPMVAVLKTILGHTSELVPPPAAAQTMTARPQDIVIIDMQQSPSCMELLRTLKMKFPTTPLIAMVPYGDLLMVEKVIAQGADDYISQPIALERLKVSLRNMLRMRALLQRASSGQNDTPAMNNGGGTMRTNFIAADGSLRTLRIIEEEAIRHAIEYCDGCMTDAAKALGVGRSTLYRKIQEMRPSGQMLRENHTTRPRMYALSE